MKLISFLLPVLLFSCHSAPKPAGRHTDSLQAINKGEAVESDTDNRTIEAQNKRATATGASFSNTRFRHVKVEKTHPGAYRVTGEAQVFEASFSWVVEDGHNELKKGYATTDAGAPQWGHFNFTVNVAKPNPALTLSLLLFEASPKDGSRQYVLPVPLP